MLGWQVFVLNESDVDKKSMISWSTGFDGLDWLDELVKQGLAQDLGGSGYPSYYKAKAQVVLKALSIETPINKGQTIMDDENVLSADWRSKIDTSELAKLKPNQQLIIEAWDLS
jgi:hypothetical protein